MSIKDSELSDLWWNDSDNLKMGSEVLEKTGIKRSSLRITGRECRSSCHDVRCHTVRYTIIMRTKYKVPLIMEKSNQNLWLGNLVHKKCIRRSVDGKIVGKLLPSEVKDAEDWFIRRTQEKSFAKEYRLLAAS